MSRHIRVIDDNRTLAYGFDHMLGYWYDVTDNRVQDEDMQIVEEESSFLTNISKADFVAKLHRHECNAEHIHKAALDLPF